MVLMQIHKDKRGFLGLIGLLFTLAIICYLFYLAVNTYFKVPLLGRETEKPSSEGFITPSQETPNYQTIMGSTRTKIRDINKKILNQGRQLENIRNE